MRLEVLSDTALRQLEPARLTALIAHVQRFIDKAVARRACRGPGGSPAHFDGL